MNVAVVGAGSWGTALARLLYYNRNEVCLWTRDAEQAESMRTTRENRHFLPGILLPPPICISSRIEDVAAVDMLVLAVPSAALEEVSAEFAPFVKPGALVVNVAKGFAAAPFCRLSQVLEKNLPQARIVVLSGPSHAEEVARDLLTTVCVAGTDMQALREAQNAFHGRNLRVYTNDDLIGVEVAGAVKNIIALGAGMLTGFAQGDNARAALMSRGLAEMTRLGVAMGANAATFSGLAGVGDLIVTCTSMHSRNFRAGLDIGRGKKWRDVVENMGQVVEGVSACRRAYMLAQQHGVEMPITEQMYSLLYEDQQVEQAISELMNREQTHEHY